MFEQTFVEGSGQTRKPWTVAVSFLLQIVLQTDTVMWAQVQSEGAERG